MIRVRLCLCAEDRQVEDDVRDVVEDMRLNLDKVRVAEDNDFDRFCRFASRVLNVFNLWYNLNQVDIRHCLAHQITPRPPILTFNFQYDLVLQSRNEHGPPLILVFRPANDVACMRVSMARVFLRHRRHMQVLRRLRAQRANDGEIVRMIRLLFRETPLVVLDPVEAPHEDRHCQCTSDNRDRQEQRVHDSAHSALPTRLEAPPHRRVIYDQRTTRDAGAAEH